MRRAGVIWQAAVPGGGVGSLEHGSSISQICAARDLGANLMVKRALITGITDSATAWAAEPAERRRKPVHPR